MPKDAPTADKQPVIRQPVIWAISAWRAGDHAQLLALAAALKQAYGWDVEFKPVCDRRQDPAGFGYTAPWPDAVIGIGRGGTRMAMWLKRASGGRSKFIQLGRSEGSMGDCDLIVTTAQYGFPDNPNLVRLTLPLTSPARPDDPAIAAWTPRLAGRPRPRFSLVSSMFFASHILTGRSTGRIFRGSAAS